MKIAKFLTPEFHICVELTLNILNRLNSDIDLLNERDMYGDGSFLFMSVVDNDTTRKILSPVIEDFEAYNQEEEEDYTGTLTDEIGLCTLQNHHREHFGWKLEIMWREDLEQFIFREDMPSRI